MVVRGRYIQVVLKIFVKLETHPAADLTVHFRLKTVHFQIRSISDFITSDKIELLSEAHGVIDQLRRSANENKVQSQRNTVHTEPHRKVTELREVREESTELTFTDNGDRYRD